MKIECLKRQTLLAAEMIRDHLTEGDSAIDATVGKGSDTLMLAESVGASGKVYAFDIQNEAIVYTKNMLQKNGLEKRVRFFQQGHETMDSIDDIRNDEKIKAVMFNLGYLPGGDRSVTTRVSSTMMAVEQALKLMAPGGLMSICVYGHEEGIEEKETIEQYCVCLPKGIDGYKIETLNHQNSPVLYIIHKRKGSS